MYRPDLEHFNPDLKTRRNRWHDSTYPLNVRSVVAQKTRTTTFTADLEFGIVVFRSVPALRCSMCGADWIQDDIAARLELIVNEAKQKRLQVEVTTLA